MRRKGSAILTILAAVVVLGILALSFIGSKSEKAGISKHMSDEKKAEALAESATDLIISFIKRNCNNEQVTGASNGLYYLLRAPLKYKGTPGAIDNAVLDIPEGTGIDDLSTYVGYEEILNPVIQEIGWEGKVKIETKCEISSAEAFTPYNSGYKVVGINQEHLPATGNTAKFLDTAPNSSISFAGEADDKWKPSDWELRIKFPNADPLKEEVSFEVDIPLVPDPEVTLIASRDAEESVVLNLEVESGTIFGDFDLGEFDIQDKMNGSHYFPDVRPVNMQGLKNRIVGDSNPEFELAGYVSEIADRFSEVSNAYSKYSITSDNFSEPMVIEKGAILRITTKVEYKKSESNTITKTLVAEAPFKVSDVQPIAPEYTFFVANSPLLCNQSDITSGNTLGEPFDMNNGADSLTTEQARKAAGRLIIHNLQNKNGKPTFDFDDGRCPGMVRVNSQYNSTADKTNCVRSFLGVFEEPNLCELNKFLTPFDPSRPGDYEVNKFDTLISFIWEDTDKKDYHEVEFPLLFEDPAHPPTSKVQEEGVTGFIDVFHEGNFDIISVPTLLFGDGGMEYPLGINAEGPITSMYSRIRVMAKPDAKVKLTPLDVKDKTEMYYDFEPVSTYSKPGPDPYPFDESGNDATKYEPTPYGMQGHECYKPNEAWNSNTEPKYMPANCYDAMQYAKKATRYYDTAEEFIADMGRSKDKNGLKDSNGNVELNGVFYVKSGDINLKGFTYTGNGLIVSKCSNIIISGDIKRGTGSGAAATDNSTLGIIARTGRIQFKCNEVHASCFSNNAPSAPESSRFKLYGNLVCNDFMRRRFTEVDVYYDNTLTSVTPLASMRKVGKFEPKRYIVAFDDNWSKFAYEKKKEEK